MTQLWNKTLINAPLIIIVTLMSIILEGCSLLGIRTTEEAHYVVEQQVENIEIRRYKPVMTVETYVEEADFQEATGLAFQRLFDYISGSNVSTNDIAMTAPVIAEPRKNTGTIIPMTSPVIASPKQSERQGWILKFVLPASLAIETAPQPTDPRLTLKHTPEKLVAAISYSGLWSENAYQEQVTQLQSWLASKQYKSTSLPSFAGYDPPWALPFLRRNEVLIDVQL